MAKVTLTFDESPSTRILQKKAKKFADEYLSFHDLWQCSIGNDPEPERVWESLESKLYEIKLVDDRLFFGAELMRYLTEMKTDSELDKLHLDRPQTQMMLNEYLDFIDELIYNIHSTLDSQGLYERQDTFSADEFKDISLRVDEILKGINQLKAGQEVIYEDISTSVAELKTFAVFGKRNFKQKLIGIIYSYGTEKIIDGVWQKLSPKLFEIASKYIEDYTRLLGASDGNNA